VPIEALEALDTDDLDEVVAGDEVVFAVPIVVVFVVVVDLPCVVVDLDVVTPVLLLTVFVVVVLLGVDAMNGYLFPCGPDAGKESGVVQRSPRPLERTW
jgi:flagellar biosynthesis component FlhA